MNASPKPEKFLSSITGLALTLAVGAAQALPINWVDWTESSNADGFTAFGTITTPTDTVGVTYHNPNGISFYQTGAGGETDYWNQGFFCC